MGSGAEVEFEFRLRRKRGNCSFFIGKLAVRDEMEGAIVQVTPGDAQPQLRNRGSTVAYRGDTQTGPRQPGA
ncbi:MAG: hypothetical protein CML06_16240 [Pseudomonadales bacterium]|nr:hypothetical protein [Pseudomonadales bacterium]